jgi:hypothetical protein
MFVLKTTIRRIVVLIFSGAVAGIGASCGSDSVGPPAGVVESRFTGGMQGWSMVGSGTLSHAPTGGNPGGHLLATDQIGGPPMYFLASPAYHGDRSAAYGRVLRFDLKWEPGADADGPVDAVEVLLWGAGASIAASLAASPAEAWTRYSVRLDTSGGWLQGSAGLPATEAEIQQVLGALEQIWIRAEFVSGLESTGLDNVVFGSQE